MPSRLGLSDILATGVQEMEKVSIHPSLSTYGLAQGSSTSISVLVPLLPPSGLKLKPSQTANPSRSSQFYSLRPLLAISLACPSGFTQSNVFLNFYLSLSFFFFSGV